MAGMIYVGCSSSLNHKTGEHELCSLNIGNTVGGFRTEAAALRAGMRIMETQREKDISVTFCEWSSVWYWRPANRKLWENAIKRCDRK